MALMPLAAQQRNTSDIDMQMRKLVFAQGAISQLYVDTVDMKKVTEEAIRGMLKELDPQRGRSAERTTGRLFRWHRRTVQHE